MYNWNIRYSKIVRQFPDLLNKDVSVLEVGSGNEGIALWLTRPVTCLERSWDGQINPWIIPIVGSIEDIPFAEKSFDYVICVDVIEHLKFEGRKKAIEELIRVARSRVIISCPAGRNSSEGEIALLEVFHRTGHTIPFWLQEHIDNGLPEVGEIFKLILNTGLSFTLNGNERRIQHFSGILMDEFFPLSKKWNIEYTRKMTREPPIGESEWDDYYSWLFCINVNKWLFPKILTWDKDKLGESPTASIYSVFHVNYPVDWLGRVTPIFVGAAAVNRGDALTDRSISATPLLNERWSELSAIYRIWKDGPKSEIVGFEHYRRLFLFKEQTTENREIFIKMEELVNYSEYLWNYKEICLVDAGTIILPKPFDAKMSVFDHYCLNHCTDDWCRILNIINENYPELLPFVAEQFDDSFFYANNLFISTWGFFSNLCSVWFDILQRFTDAVPIRQGMIYQNRDVSFLAERVFDIWIRYCRSRGLKIIHNPIVFVEYPPK